MKTFLTFNRLFYEMLLNNALDMFIMMIKRFAAKKRF